MIIIIYIISFFLQAIVQKYKKASCFVIPAFIFLQVFFCKARLEHHSSTEKSLYLSHLLKFVEQNKGVM
jgi:hypothetical protein